jgi:hypothetical protein
MLHARNYRERINRRVSIGMRMKSRQVENKRNNLAIDEIFSERNEIHEIL